MLLRFTPITSFDFPELTLSLFELYAFASGEALFSDLPIDFDTILHDAQDEPAKYNLENEQDILKDEPLAARQLLEEFMVSRVFELMDARSAKFGANYAFERVPGSDSSIRRKQADSIQVAAYATAWLSFFYAIDADEALDMPAREVRALRMLYARVFEIVALLACSAIGPSVGWWTGRDWTEHSKIENFKTLCDVVGYGVVKPIEYWEDRERQAKDAGVDGFLVTTIGGAVTSASVCIALGVTVQKKQRQKKKVGKDQRERLLAFYVNRPTISLIGAAADPYPREAVLAQDYAAADCLYLHGETLWELLRLYRAPSQTGNLAHMLVAIEEALKNEMRKALEGAQVQISGVSHNLDGAFEGYAPAA
jgi:hypothetical protein